MTVQSNEFPFLVIEDGDQPTRKGIEIKVWDRADSTHLVNVVARRRKPKYLEQHNGDGGGSFEIRVDDEALVDTPTLLDEGNLVEHVVDGVTVGWWQIEKKPRQTIPEGEYAGEWFTVSGRGLRAWLGNGLLYPVGGPVRVASGTRAFNFAGPQGAWYDPADWAAVVAVTGTPWGANPVPASETNQEGWPVTTSWIWDRDTSGGAPEGDVFFRREFTTGSAADCRIYLTCDDLAAVYLDGQPVMTVTEFAAWQRQFTVDLTVPAGDHVLAIRGRNRGTTPAGVNMALVTIPAEGAVTDANRLVWTGQSGWVCNGYPDPEPGWSCGLVLETLLVEAAARGVAGLSDLVIDFTETVDSYGVPWTDALEWRWSVGTSYAKIVEEFSGTVADAWVDDAKVLRLAPERGFDRSIQNAGQPPIILAKGFNVTSAETDSVAEITNVVLAKTADGWAETIEPTGSVAAYGRREGYLSAVEASEQGVVARLVGQVFAKYARPRRTPTVTIVGTDGHTPWTDFGVADWVLAPDDDDPDSLVKRRVVSIACEEADAGDVLYSLEIDTIEETTDTRVARWLESIGRGTFSGGVSGATGDTGGGQPLGTSPMAATGTPGLPGPAGPVGVEFRGAWSGATEYVVRDAVSYDGSMWYALQPSVNVAPVDGAYWALVVDRGDDGPEGAPGDAGADGASAYALAVAGGFVGDQAAWLASLVGADGATGADGVGVPVGGTTGQVLNKTSAVDYATGWADVATGGGSSISTDFKGDWLVGTTYLTEDLVVRGGDTYVALTGNTGVDPATEGTPSDVGGTVNEGLTGSQSYSLLAGYGATEGGTVFTAGGDITVTHVEVYVLSSLSAGAKVGIRAPWVSGGGEPAWLGYGALTSASVATGWVKVPLPTPVALLTGQKYTVSVEDAGGVRFMNNRASMTGAVASLQEFVRGLDWTSNNLLYAFPCRLYVDPNAALAWLKIARYDTPVDEVRAAAAPTTGTAVVGDKVYNSVPAASGFIGWVCVTAGTPGTWKTFGAISA